MTQEEKQLLLVDLCARLPYGVKVLVESHKGTFLGTLVTVTTKLSYGALPHTLGEAWIEEINEALWCDYRLFKPYLRPMSSMTEEEKKEYTSYVFEQPFLQKDKTPNLGSVPMCIDWLLIHHFDFRGLIEKGLALEAPEGMYEAE